METITNTVINEKARAIKPPRNRKSRVCSECGQKLPGTKKLKRSWCDNCGEQFAPAVKWQKFCCAGCKSAFHKAGGVSFKKWSRLVESAVAKVKRELKADLEALEKRLYRDVREVLRKGGVTRELRDVMKTDSANAVKDQNEPVLKRAPTQNETVIT